MPSPESSPEASLSEYFTLDHRNCDSQWANVEAAAGSGDAERVRTAWQSFDQAQRRHLAREEELMFPAFEAATGMSGGGPTFVMRSEHEQMRGLLDQMAAAAAEGNHDELIDQGDTLLMLIQQHNQKEESILYPMAERALGGEWAALRRRIEEL